MKGLKILAGIVSAGSVVVAAIVAYNAMTEGNQPHARLPGTSVGIGPTTRVKQYQVPAVKPREFRPIGPDSALALNAREPELETLASSCSLLLRELARQSVLIAARQGLGVPTRDCTLREGTTGPIINDDAAVPNPKVLEIDTTAIKGKSL